MSENRDLARALLAAARRRANKFTRDKEARSKAKQSGGIASEDAGEYQGPQLLNESLAELIAQRGWQEKMKDSDLFIKWSELVGPDIADHVQPLAFADGVLTVSAESTAWATQIRLIDAQIRNVLARGGFEVSELVIKGPNAPSWRRGGWSVKGGRGPRDTYG
jgi:predicted nucleic acid-binding Zn ribbon protein